MAGGLLERSMSKAVCILWTIFMINLRKAIYLCWMYAIRRNIPRITFRVRLISMWESLRKGLMRFRQTVLLFLYVPQETGQGSERAFWRAGVLRRCIIL